MAMSDQTERPGSLAAALITLQTRLPRITKDAEGQAGQRVTKYLSLSALHAAVFPLLAEVGLAWICLPTMTTGDRFVLMYKLVHVATGEEEIGEYPLPESGGSQALGSAITYARRYALTAVLGIAPADDDDDGHAAEQAAQWRPPANPRTRKAQRSKGTPDDDPFYDQGEVPDPSHYEDAPASILPKQRARLMAAYNKAGILAREDRLAYAMSKLDLPELASSNDLSMRQAGQLIAYLEAERDT